MNPGKSGRKGVEIPIAEEALARLAAIVENSNEAIIGRALDGTVVSWNAAAKRILGYNAAEVIGRDLVAYFPPELLHQITERRKIVRAGQSVPDHQSVRLTKDGRRIDVALSISPVRDNRGNIIGTATIMRDITERKRAEQLLALEHTVARCLADAGDASEALKAVIRAICETENWACGRYLRVDDKAAVLRFGDYWSVPDPVIQGLIEGSRGLTYGLGVALSGTVWQSGQPLWIADNTKDARAQTTVFAVESGMRGAFAFPVKSEGETIGVFVFNSREVREPDTRLLAAIHVIGSQIGQFLRRKRVEAERIWLTAIVENSNDAIISRALDGTIQSWNAGAERLFGYAAAEAIGRSATFIMPPDLQSDLARDTEKLLRGEVIAPLEIKHMTNDGRVLDVLVSRSPIKDDAGNIVGASVIFQDISAIKQAEAAMKINEERFRATFEQAAVGIAHTTSDRRFLAVNQQGTATCWATPAMSCWRCIRTRPSIPMIRMRVSTWSACLQARSTPARATGGISARTAVYFGSIALYLWRGTVPGSRSTSFA